MKAAAAIAASVYRAAVASATVWKPLTNAALAALGPPAAGCPAGSARLPMPAQTPIARA